MKKIIAALLCAGMTQACVPPGKGRKAKASYKEAQPLIDALAAYQKANQQYPDTINQLIPEYLPAVSNPFDYKKTAEGYSIHFTYTGPGINHCTYTPKTLWSCYGYL